MKTINVTRREFLTIAGISAGVVSTYPLIEKVIRLYPEIHFQNLLYRGTFDGFIQASNDDGQTWQQQMNFGSHIQVVNFEIDRNRLFATLKLGNHAFLVESEDGKIWKTV